MTDPTDLPTDPNDLTPDQARNAPASDATDLLCLQVLDIPARRWGYDQPKMGGREPEIRAHYLTSRHPRAAHRAREHIRNQGLSVELHDEAAAATREYDDDTEYGEWAVFGDVGEHLLSARLLLTLYAEDVL